MRGSPHERYCAHIKEAPECSLEDFPGSPVVKTPPSKAGGSGLIPVQETKIPHAERNGQKLKEKKKIRVPCPLLPFEDIVRRC